MGSLGKLGKKFHLIGLDAKKCMTVSNVPEEASESFFFLYGLGQSSLEKPVWWVSTINSFYRPKHPIQVEVISHAFSDLCKEVQIKLWIFISIFQLSNILTWQQWTCVRNRVAVGPRVFDCLEWICNTPKIPY